MYLMQMATPIRLTAKIDIATPGDASVANPHENPIKEKSKTKEMNYAPSPKRRVFADA